MGVCGGHASICGSQANMKQCVSLRDCSASSEGDQEKQIQETSLLSPSDQVRIYRSKAFECRKLAETSGLCAAQREGYLLVADVYDELSLDKTASKEQKGTWWVSILRAKVAHLRARIGLTERPAGP